MCLVANFLEILPYPTCLAHLFWETPVVELFGLPSMSATAFLSFSPRLLKYDAYLQPEMASTRFERPMVNLFQPRLECRQNAPDDPGMLDSSIHHISLAYDGYPKIEMG